VTTQKEDSDPPFLGSDPIIALTTGGCKAGMPAAAAGSCTMHRFSAVKPSDICQTTQVAGADHTFSTGLAPISRAIIPSATRQGASAWEVFVK
jgi:hypothetical protein